jgi:tetratricopeptide (TPR) repeat protein
MGDFSQAIAYHTQRLAIAREVGDRAGEGNAYGSLGNAHDSMGDFAQAIAYHTQHLAIAREVGDRAGEGNAGNNLGVALEKNGNLPAAAHALVQALAAFQRVERDLGAHDDRRVSLFEQQQTTYMLLQGVLLGLEQPGWALGVAAQAKGRALLYLSTTSRRAALGTATRTTPPWSPLMARMRPYTRRGGGRCSRTRRPRATPARSASWSIRFCRTIDWPSGC